ncbi:Arm DNA-binding domain-containing protein [Salmonella enterica]|uniref:Arm DNA-binding domain-containing protein n=1 Tax=Salmonella enterica TaxID=28901 RepID=UPI002FC8D098
MIARSAPRPLEKPYKNHRFTNSVPDGSKLWYFRYRFGGKENRLTFGPYPQVSTWRRVWR